MHLHLPLPLRLRPGRNVARIPAIIPIPKRALAPPVRVARLVVPRASLACSSPRCCIGVGRGLNLRAILTRLRLHLRLRLRGSWELGVGRELGGVGASRCVVEPVNPFGCEDGKAIKGVREYGQRAAATRLLTSPPTPPTSRNALSTTPLSPPPVYCPLRLQCQCCVCVLDEVVCVDVDGGGVFS